MTKTRIVVADSKIHILGAYQNIRMAKDSIVNLILGAYVCDMVIRSADTRWTRIALNQCPTYAWALFWMELVILANKPHADLLVCRVAAGQGVRQAAWGGESGGGSDVRVVGQ